MSSSKCTVDLTKAITDYDFIEFYRILNKLLSGELTEGDKKAVEEMIERIVEYPNVLTMIYKVGDASDIIDVLWKWYMKQDKPFIKPIEAFVFTL